MAVLRTIDPKKGLIVLYIAPGCEEEVGNILGGLKEKTGIETVSMVGRGDI